MLAKIDAAIARYYQTEFRAAGRAALDALFFADPRDVGIARRPPGKRPPSRVRRKRPQKAPNRPPAELAHYPVPCRLVPLAAGDDTIDVQQIVLNATSDPGRGIFSAATPLALALAGRRAGDQVEVAGISYVIAGMGDQYRETLGD